VFFLLFVEKLDMEHIRAFRVELIVDFSDLYLYAEFKKMNPGLKVGFSKFYSLCPKWCVTVSSSGAHSVCVCK